MKGEYKTKPRNLIMAYLKKNPDTRFTAMDILNAVLEEAAAKIRSTYGIDIDYGKTLIIGVCNDCKDHKGK